MKRLTALAVVLLMSACDAFMEPSPTAPEPGPPEPAMRPGPNSDWPDPVRVEPAQGAVVHPPEGAAIQLHDDGKFTDFLGDIGDGPAWLDITDVAFGLQTLDGCCVAVAFNLAEPFPDPPPHRGDRWIAYGLVLDVDGDGTADVRIGMDNLSNRGGHRAWRTDLTTAVTFYRHTAGSAKLCSIAGTPAMTSIGTGMAILLWASCPEKRNSASTSGLR